MYEAAGFLEKNMEKMPGGLAGLLCGSKRPLLRNLGDAMEASAINANSTTGGRRKVRSTVSTFRASLRAMTSKINAAERHYIRCVKPNSEKVAGNFDAPMVREQLLFS